MSDLSAVVWFTPARRIPRLIGKLPSGEHLWGGPYELRQAVTFGIVMFLGWLSMPLWGQWDIFNWLVVLPVALLVGFLARWIPRTTVNPFLIGAGVAALVVPASGYRRRGRRLTLPPVHSVRSRARMQAGQPSVRPSQELIEPPAPATTRVLASTPVAAEATALNLFPTRPLAPVASRQPVAADAGSRSDVAAQYAARLPRKA